MTEQHLLEVIPKNLIQDDVDYKIAEAIGNQEAKLFLRVNQSIIDDNFEEHPDVVLLHLLWENHLLKKSEGLALANNKKERADLIRASIQLHRYKGTPYAIERALKAVKIKGKTEEWFDYDGEPYHFWVELSLNQKLNDLKLIREMIMEYKNVRSWFEGFVIAALDQGFWYWDDSYSYPVYYKTANDFWGEATTDNHSLSDLTYRDDSYSYPVYYEDMHTVLRQEVDANAGLSYDGDDYSYPVYYKECGGFETPDTTSVQFNGATEVSFEAYGYPAYYPVCGEFETGG